MEKILKALILKSFGLYYNKFENTPFGGNMPHFFIDSSSVNHDLITVSDDNDAYFHLTLSMRIKQDEMLKFIDENKVSYCAKVVEISKRKIVSKIISKEEKESAVNFEIHLAQSVLGSQSQFEIVKKSTELGVFAIYPILTDFSSVNKESYAKKVAKMCKVAFEASKQCERCDVPLVVENNNLEGLIKNECFDHKIVFSEKENQKTLKQFLKSVEIKRNDKVLVVIGPEGGFSAREFEMFEQFQIPQVSLGKTILKADTACIVSVANLIYDKNSYEE